MKKIKFVFALLAVFSALSFGLVLQPTSSAAEAAAGKKCTCVYQSGSAGVIENNDCVVQDCWIPIESLE
ncbi:MAG TPA: hypothetical protein VF527_15565 [Pyrinomonadaceae bacterium]|jgi:hypothetical protein